MMIFVAILIHFQISAKASELGGCFERQLNPVPGNTSSSLVLQGEVSGHGHPINQSQCIVDTLRREIKAAVFKLEELWHFVQERAPV